MAPNLSQMGFSNPKYQAMQARSDPNVYVQYWKTSLCKAPCENPLYCCYAMWCPWCASCGLRKQALHGDMSRYICCNGACPCSGRCGESSCPSCCLCLESVCCFAMSVAATRYMIQDELRIQTTKCDNCIITTMIVLEYIACVCHILACITGSEEIAAVANLIQLIADVVWCSVCACMQTQHKTELEQRDKGGVRPPPLPTQAPGVQMIPMGGPPPQGGYAPPPPGYYPPPHPSAVYPYPAAPQPYPPPPQQYPPPGYYPPAGYAGPPGQQMQR